jgi:hypothetical protein
MPLKLGEYAPGTGITFRSFGYPPRMDPYVGLWITGTVNGFDQVSSNLKRLWLLSSEISPGSSGAPVLDDQSETVIGIIEGFNTEDRNGRAIPAEVFRDVCEQITSRSFAQFYSQLCSRLSESGEQALLWAESLRRSTNGGAIYSEYILAGLFQNRDGFAYRLLTLFDGEDEVLPRLEALANKLTNTQVSIQAIKPVSPEFLAALVFSLNTERALQMANDLAKEYVSSRDILAGLLITTESWASQWVAELLQIDQPTLYHLLLQEPDERTLLATIRQASKRAQSPTKPTALEKIIQIDAQVIPAQVETGKATYLHFDINFLGSGIQAQNLQGEITLMIQTDAAYIPDGQNILTLPITAEHIEAVIELQARIPGQHTIQIFPYYNRKRLSAASARLDILPTNQPVRLELPDPAGPRPVPQPDLTIRAYTNQQGEDDLLNLDYVLYSPHPALLIPGTSAGSIKLKRSEIARRMARLAQSLQVTSEGYIQTSEALAATGNELYDLLFPEPLKKLYQEIHEKIRHILILTDASLWIPWELIKPHGLGWKHNFLGASYYLGRWVDGWGGLRRAEFPIGQVALVQGAGIEKYCSANEWNDLFAEGDLPRLVQRLFIDSPGSYAEAMAYTSPVWGLHFAMISERLGTFRKEVIPVDASQFDADKVRDYALDLHAKRSLVTFSSLTPTTETALSEVETRWLPTYIQSGASAFVSTLWSTPPDVDRLFWQSFYREIWNKRSLGEAVFNARHVLRQAYPDRWDWLAYFLVGDPMAVGYLPRPGDGFVTLECLKHDIRQPLTIGKRYSFLASLRDVPPVWHQERLYRSSLENWGQPSVHIFAPAFDIKPEIVLPLEEVGPGIHQTRFELTPQRAQSSDVFIKFVSESREVRHTISFSLNIAGKGGNQ